MKNRKNIYIVSGIITILVIVGVVMFLRKSKPTETAKPPEEQEQQTNLPQVDSSVVVALKPRSDNKAVNLTISNIPADTLSIEYELSYITGAGLPKGAIGKIDLNGKTEIIREILLGTCSKNVCTYDNGVTSVSLVLKFNGPKGSSQFTKDYPME